MRKTNTEMLANHRLRANDSRITFISLESCSFKSISLWSKGLFLQVKEAQLPSLRSRFVLWLVFYSLCKPLHFRMNKSTCQVFQVSFSLESCAGGGEALLVAYCWYKDSSFLKSNLLWIIYQWTAEKEAKAVKMLFLLLLQFSLDCLIHTHTTH